MLPVSVYLPFSTFEAVVVPLEATFNILIFNSYKYLDPVCETAVVCVEHVVFCMTLACGNM
jgi:hypothetical protein